MDNVCGGQINHLPAGLFDLKTIIGILLVGEKTLIKQANPFDHLAADEHTRARDTIHQIGLIFIQVIQQVSAE
jgi:hypothetical protein